MIVNSAAMSVLHLLPWCTWVRAAPRSPPGVELWGHITCVPLTLTADASFLPWFPVYNTLGVAPLLAHLPLPALTCRSPVTLAIRPPSLALCSAKGTSVTFLGQSCLECRIHIARVFTEHLHLDVLEAPQT